MWKDFFYFSRNERRGVIVLIVLIVVVCGIAWFLPDRDTPSAHSSRDLNEEYADFVESLQEVKKEQKQYSRYPKATVKTEINYTTFDPNTADSITLLQLGLPGWMIKNIFRYRAKGGRFKTTEDFAKVYGLKPGQYELIAPYIAIEPLPLTENDSMNLFVESIRKDSFPKTIKYEPGVIVELNSADTIELKKIPGIGSTIARMIVKYRNQLGGYYSVSQLAELNLKSDLLNSWFEIELDSISPLCINKMGVEALRRHPYLNFYQAKVIVEHRRKQGKIKSIKELMLYDEFTESDFSRLEYYLQFD